MSMAANALCAKAKAMYGNRLNQNVYSDLVRKQSVNDIVTYLKTQTNYDEALKDINVRNAHRQQVEDCLNKEYYRRCSRLMRYVDKAHQEFYLFEIIGVEINLIMDKIYALKAKDKYSFNLAIPEYLAKKTSFNIYGLVNIDSFEALVQYLQKTSYYKILKDIDLEIADLNEAHSQLLKFYYDKVITIIKKHFKGKTREDLLNILYTSIELKNITKIYRYKQYFHETPENIQKSLLLDYSRLSKKMIEQLVNAKEAQDVLNILAHSIYQRYLDDKEYSYIEYYMENINYNIAKRHIRFSNNAPVVYLTYCIIQKIEIANLKHIIEGIRYKQSISKIENTLIYA